MPDGTITVSKFGDNNILLGYDDRDTDVSYGGSLTSISGLSVTVTVPADVVCIAELSGQSIRNNTGGAITSVSIWDGTVGSGTQLAVTSWSGQNALDRGSLYARSKPTVLSAGSHTINTGIVTSAGIATLPASSTGPLVLTVTIYKVA